MDFTQENFDKLQADLAAEIQKNTELTTELGIANEKIQGLADQKDELENQLNALMSGGKNKSNEKDQAPVFEYDGKKYRYLGNSMRFPKIGKRTALEIITDAEAQKWLVESKSEMIREII